MQMAMARGNRNHRVLGHFCDVAPRRVVHFVGECVADSPDAGKCPCDNQQRNAAQPRKAEFAGRLDRVAAALLLHSHAHSLTSSMPSRRQRAHPRRPVVLESPSAQDRFRVHECGPRESAPSRTVYPGTVPINLRALPSRQPKSRSTGFPASYTLQKFFCEPVVGNPLFPKPTHPAGQLLPAQFSRPLRSSSGSGSVRRASRRRRRVHGARAVA